MPISDLTGTTWQFKDIVTPIGDGTVTHSFSVNIEINGVTTSNGIRAPNAIYYSQLNATFMTVGLSNSTSASYMYLKTTDYLYTAMGLTDGEGWYSYEIVDGNPVYTKVSAPTITIIDGTDVQNLDLIAWLEENTVGVDETKPSSFEEISVNDNPAYLAITVGEETFNIKKVSNFLISKNVINGTISGPSTISDIPGSSAIFTITPNQGYPYPETVTVTNATLDYYNKRTGELKISEATADVTIQASCTTTISSSLIFSSENTFSIKMNEKKWEGTLYWSRNNSDWNVWSSASTTATSGEGKVIYLRGEGNTVFNTKIIYTGNTGFRCDGNIEVLLDYQTVLNNMHPQMSTRCFYNLFYGCTTLLSAPVLPATTLADSCYQGMFAGCTSLVTAPALPATTLESSCYYQMFQSCTSLTSAPALPATTLADYCYNLMFSGCTSLTSAPALPATTLASYCYKSMFYGCTALTSAPALPATTLTTECYYFMFYNCTTLLSAPALPATTLERSCYSGMFEHCTSLTIPPSLPATTLENYCYNYMFSGCTSLTTLPKLPATTLTTACYTGMFEGCTNIKLSATQTGNYTKPYRIPTSGTGTTATNALGRMFTDTGGTFTGTPSINTTYYTQNQPV